LLLAPPFEKQHAMIEKMKKTGIDLLQRSKNHTVVLH